ncbi:hypothetical protein [Nocardiopsis rhodophaea]|uniref:Kelch repeat-containing protein n=1 Tax=Nocardiopsis rhodophaea TaxID=280238 RepID=UPI0039EF5A85
MAALLLSALAGTSCAPPGPVVEELDVSVERIDGAPLPMRSEHTAVLSDAGNVITWGGESLAGTGRRADGAVFDIDASRWEPLSPSPLAPRTRHVAVWTHEGMLVWGGAATEGSLSPASDGAIYDPEADAWSRISDAPVGMRSAMAVTSGSWVVIGGGDTDGGGRRTLLLYSVDADQWSRIRVPLRIEAMSAADEGTVIVTGGGDDGAVAVYRVRLASEQLEAIPVDGDRGDAPDGLGAAAAPDGTVYITTTSSRATRLMRVEPDSGTARVRTFPDVGFMAPVDVRQSPLNRGRMWWHAGRLVSEAVGHVTTIDPESGDMAATALYNITDDHYCGAGAPAVMRGATIVVWSGKNCYEGDASLVKRGVAVKLPE